MKTLLIKLSGEIFSYSPSQKSEGLFIKNLLSQIKELKKTFNLGIVIGGGNIFRGSKDGKKYNLRPTTAHCAGMLATIINGLILKDLLEKSSMEASILSALACPIATELITQENIDKNISKNRIIIFVGGTGNPFFTTDTNAMLRALQMESEIVFKGTKVDGIFDTDPMLDPKSKLLKKISYDYFIEKELKIMDLAAITLAKEHKIKMKVFNIFEPNALIKAYKDKNFGSSIN